MNYSTKKYITILLNLTITLSLILFISHNYFSSFEIKTKAIVTFINRALLLLLPPTLIWNFIVYKNRKQKILTNILPIIGIILMIKIGPFKIMSSYSVWSTQEILYCQANSSAKIERQAKNSFFEKSTRLVKVSYLSPHFMFVQPVTIIEVEKRTDWTICK